MDDPTPRAPASLVLTMKSPPEIPFLYNTLFSVVPHVSQLIVVVTSPRRAEPHVRAMTGLWASTHAPPPIPTSFVEVDPTTHPNLFLDDVASTYNVGHPLADENFQGHFTGEKMLVDWAAARNLGYSRCSQKWRLHLDDNEILGNSQHIPATCSLLEKNAHDLALVLRQSSLIPSRSRGSNFCKRITLNVPTIKWEGPACETLEGELSPTAVGGGLYVAPGSYHSSPEHALQFRVLYALARKSDWSISPIHLLNLAESSVYLHFEKMARPALYKYLDTATDPESRSWAYSLLGILAEDKAPQDLDHLALQEASSWYRRSFKEYPHWKTSLRLSRTHYLMKDYTDCLVHYDEALRYQSISHAYDHGPEDFASTLLLVAESHHQLGHADAADTACRQLLLLYPKNTRVQALCSHLLKDPQCSALTK